MTSEVARQVLTDYWTPLITGRGRVWTRKELAAAYLDEIGVRRDAPWSRMGPHWREHVALFFIQVLGIVPWVHLQHPGKDQLAMIEAVSAHARRLPGAKRPAVRTGHKTAKSNSVSGTSIWYYMLFPGARVFITNASFRQVRDINFYEINGLFRAGRLRGIDFGGQVHADPMIGVQLEDGRQIVGFSADEPEKAAGISGRNLGYHVDEGSGANEKVYTALEGNRAGGAWLAMWGNPTQTVGTFYDAFHSKREFYNCIHVPSTYTPNCQAGRTIVPGLADPEWVDEKRREWGEENPVFLVRVMGEFPPQGPTSVFPISLIEAAKERWREYDSIKLPYDDAASLDVGVDPAFEGDDEAVIYGVIGHRALPPVTLPKSDEKALARAVRDFVARHWTHGRAVNVRVDAIGEGRAVVNELSSSDYAPWLAQVNATVTAVDVREKAADPAKYHNRRAEVAFALRDWLAAGGAIPDDSKLEGEMAGLPYLLTPKGQYKIPDKPEEKKRLKRSPDRREALSLAVYGGSSYTIEYQAWGTRQTARDSFRNFLNPAL